MVRWISEREYEFCAGREFIATHSQVLHAPPRLPSSRVEAVLGYGLSVKLRKRSKVKSLFFQFKVAANYVTQLRGRNAPQFRYHGGRPYLYFYITRPAESKQHNILVRLCRKKRGRVWYVAPQFVVWPDLRAHYAGGDIWRNSIRVDPLRIRLLKDNLPHKVTYEESGTSYRPWSDPMSPGDSPSLQSIEDETTSEDFTEEYIHRLLEDVMAAAGSESKSELDQQEVTIFDQLLGLLRKLDLRWYLFADA
jgi:hypothetical protein